MGLLIGLLALAIKILFGALSLGILIGVGYVAYKAVSWIPDNRVTEPVKPWLMAALMLCFLGVVFFSPVAPVLYGWVTAINALIPPDLQLWRMATG